MTPKIVADFETQLATAISIGGTSFTLASATDDDGVSLPTGLYYFTVDNGSTSKEYLAGTVTGTAVTAVVSVSRQGVETSGAVRAHRVGASVILTDFATYMKYMNAIALVSAPDASVSAKGVAQAATLAQVRARTGTGSTGAVLVPTPNVLTDLPTQEEKNFLLSSVGMIVMYGGSATPTGFLLCDGTAVSRTTYAALFTVIASNYGAGDGSTTFNVPDLRARIALGLGAGTFTTTFANTDVNTGTDIITVPTNTSLYDGTVIRVTTTGTLPTGLSLATDYYVIRQSATTIKLATSLANALAGTPVAIDITAQGTGTNTVTVTLTTRTIGQKGGEELRSMSVAELPSHAHTGQRDNGAGSGGVFFNQAGTGSLSTNATGGNIPHNVMNPFVVVNYIIKT